MEARSQHCCLQFPSKGKISSQGCIQKSTGVQEEVRESACENSRWTECTNELGRKAASNPRNLMSRQTVDSRHCQTPESLSARGMDTRLCLLSYMLKRVQWVGIPKPNQRIRSPAKQYGQNKPGRKPSLMLEKRKS